VPGFALGIAAGPVLWFWILLKLMTMHRHRLRPEMLERFAKLMPFMLLGLSVILLARAVIELIGHR
jgi:hypothetical protein